MATDSRGNGPEAGPSEVAESRCCGAVKTILLAEDEEPLRQMASMLLRLDGYDVIVAKDGNDAIEQSKNHTGALDLLLSDIEMPGMSGMQLAADFRLHRPRTKVLLMSGRNYRQACLEQGWQFIPKPFGLQDLIAGVQLALETPLER